MVRDISERYGRVDWTRADVRTAPCLSLDMRAEFGVRVPDETVLTPPGTFTLSVFAPVPGEPPIGEIRIAVNGKEVRLVGALTGRPGVCEITPDHFLAAGRDPAYAATLRASVGLVQ